ncbi:hypothetical protein JRQ81_004379, partial [Phrynocephalus forsythii]
RKTAATVAMDSLNHLKTNYRPRYLNKEGQKQAFDIPGENVLKYIQGCFDTCAKEFKVCSPALSTCSPSILIQDQDQLPTQNKDKEQPERDKINDVNKDFDVFTFLPSPDKRDACLDDNVSSLDVDIDMISLGSPALLIDEMSREMMLRFEDEAYEMDFQNSRDVRESERYPSTKEVKKLSIEEAKCSATPSSKKEMPRSLASLKTIACSFAQQNSANVEPEDECEFLIEESFGIPSSSWISSSKKSPKPRKNRSKKTPPQEKERTRQHDVNIQNKRGSQKLVTLSPVNQTEIKSTNAAKRTVDGLQNVSRTDGTMSPVDEKSLLISSTVQEGRQHGLSKHDTSVGINNRVSEVRRLTEDHASLLEEKQRNCSSISKKTVKQTHSKTNPSIEMKNKESQDSVTAVLVSEDNQGSQDSNIRSKNKIPALKPICSEGSSTNLLTRTPTKSRKWRNSPRITSSEKALQTRRNNVTESSVKISRREKRVLDSEESFQSEHGDEQCNEVDENPFLKEIQRLTHSGKNTHQRGRAPTQSHKRQNSQRITSSKKTLQTQRNNVTGSNFKITRREKRVLDSEESFQSEHGDKQCNEMDENPFLKEIHSLTHSGQKTHQRERTSTQSCKRQNSQRIASSKKAPQIRRNNVTGSNVKITRRKKSLLDLEESLQSEHGDKQCNEVDENPFLKEIQRLSHSGKKTHQERRKAVLVTPRGNNCGRASHQEDSPKHNLTEKRSNASIKQQNHDVHLLKYSCEPDIELNVSGPVDTTDLTFLQDMSSSGNDLNSESESEDRVEAMNGLVSNSLKHKLVFPTNTPHVRRTKRMRVKPLEYWRGERVNYRTRPSGGFVIGGIISPEQKEPRQPKPKRAKQSAVELEDMVSLKDPSQPALVFDAASNQEVLQECVRSGSSQLITINNEVACIRKYLNTPSFATGKIVLKPLKEKGYQYSHTDTLVFHVANGKLLLTMYDQCYSLTTGDYFFIPPGNVYNLHNLLNKECVMLFTQLKGKRPEN